MNQCEIRLSKQALQTSWLPAAVEAGTTVTYRPPLLKQAPEGGSVHKSVVLLELSGSHSSLLLSLYDEQTHQAVKDECPSSLPCTWLCLPVLTAVHSFLVCFQEENDSMREQNISLFSFSRLKLCLQCMCDGLLCGHSWLPFCRCLSSRHTQQVVGNVLYIYFETKLWPQWVLLILASMLSLQQL